MFRRTFFLIALTSAITSLPAQEILDKVVAVVDENIILRSELQQFAYSAAIQNGIDPEKDPEKFGRIQSKMLEELITQKALLTKAKEDSVVVSDRQINGVLDDQIQQMVRQLGSEKRVEDYFGSNIRQIRREFRPEVEERLLVQKLRETKSYQVHISRREVEEFYKTFRDSLPTLKDAVKISHILVRIEPSDAAIAAGRKKGEEVLRRVQAGEDFAGLAKQFSEGPSGPKGGDLGFSSRGDMVREYEEVAFSMKPGQISDLVRSEFGWHIIQLLEKQGERINTRHILFQVDKSPDDEQITVRRLERLREKILAGETAFGDAVTEFSKDKDSSSKGGDLGWFELEAFQIPAFKAAVAGLEPGDISAPVKTRFGYHIVRVDERRQERKLDVRQDWERIEGWALEIKRRREFDAYVSDIKKDVYIEIKEP